MKISRVIIPVIFKRYQRAWKGNDDLVYDSNAFIGIDLRYSPTSMVVLRSVGKTDNNSDYFSENWKLKQFLLVPSETIYQGSILSRIMRCLKLLSPGIRQIPFLRKNMQCWIR